MDSLLANYASSDDEADETLPTPTASAPAGRREEARPKPPAAAAASGGGIFSSLPQPKSAPLFSSLPAPKSGPAFSAIRPPKSSSSGNPKRVVQFRPPPIRQPTGESSDEEDDAEKRRPSEAEARPPVSAGTGPVSSFLPPPKHSLGIGGGAARRSAIDTAAPERSNVVAAGPSTSAVKPVAPESPNTTSADEDDESHGSSDEDEIPVPEEQQEQLGVDSEAGQQQQNQQQSYDAGVGSSNGQEGYAWDPNYYANYGANYGWDPSGNVNYGTEAQYAAYGGEHGGVYGNTYEVEHGDGYAHSTEMAYGGGYAGGYVHNVAAATAPPIKQSILPPEVGRIGGKRGRSDMPAEILEVNQAELMKNRPREDKSKLTGMAFGPSYQFIRAAIFLITDNRCKDVIMLVIFQLRGLLYWFSDLQLSKFLRLRQKESPPSCTKESTRLVLYSMI